MQGNNAIILLSRPPQINRLVRDDYFTGLPWTDIDALFTAMLDDIIEAALRLDSTDVILYRDQTGFSDEDHHRFLENVRCHDVHRGAFAGHIAHGIDAAFGEGYARLIVVLENDPRIDTDFLQGVLDQLHYEDDCIVIGPNVEGKCYLLGMKSNHSMLFKDAEGDQFNAPDVLIRRVCKSDVVVFLTRPLDGLDTGINLSRLKHALNASGSVRRTSALRTAGMFKSLEKKYKLQRTNR